MNLSKFFIDRPIFAGVLSLLIFIGGLLSIRALPISEYPDVVPPSVVVRAQYPGANPKVIAETVATPLEEAINGVEDMLYMSSQATTDGLMTLTVSAVSKPKVWATRKTAVIGDAAMTSTCCRPNRIRLRGGSI